MAEARYHFWLGTISGYVWAMHRDYKLSPRPGEKLRYMGYTTSIGWPKKLNTGRVLQKPSPKSKSKQRKRQRAIAKAESERLRQQMSGSTMLS